MKKSERKIIYQWSVSIFLVVIIPIIFGCILYAYSLRNIRQKAEETNQRAILEKEDRMSQLCEDLNDLSSRIMVDSDVNVILKGGSTRADGTDVYLQVQKLLKEKQQENPSVREIYLYFPLNGLLLGDSYCFDIAGNEEYVRRKLGMERAAFFQMLSGSIMNTLHVVEDTGVKEQQLVYTSALRDNVSFVNQRIIVLFYVDTDYFDRSLCSDGMNVYVKDETGGVYKILTEEENIGLEDIKEADFTRDSLWWRGGCCIFGTELAYYRVSLYTVQQEVHYIQELRNMMWLLGGYILLCAVLGGLLSYLVSRWNYKPVGELADMLSRHKKEEDGSGWEMLQESVRQLMKGYEQERERSRSMDEIMQDVRISRILVKGERLDGQSQKEQKKGRYLVISFDAEEIMLEGQAEGTWSKEQDRRLIYFIIENVATELLGEDYQHISGAIENFYYFILWKPERFMKKEGFLEEIQEGMLRLCSFFEESYQLRVCVNISRLAEEEQELYQCYQDVLCLTQYRIQQGSETALLAYSEMEKNPALKELERDWMLCRQVDDLLKERQIEEAARKLLDRLPQDEVEQVKRGTEKKKSQETANRLEQVLAYIEENYCEPQMTVGAIAERFGIHISTLSRDMKQKKGVGVLEYIGSLRLKRAKELLTQGMSVNDTAKEVGYYSSRPLVRLFQEQEGLTPAQYSKMVGKAKQ